GAIWSRGRSGRGGLGSLSNPLRVGNRTLQETLNWTSTCIRGRFCVSDAKQRIACEQCGDQKQDTSRETDLARTLSACVYPQQVPDPFRERTAVHSHGKCWSAAPFF